MSHVLTRAIGLDSQLRIDYCDVELNAGDRFLLLSDGVWAALRNCDIDGACSRTADAQRLADALVADALRAGTQDNVSATVADVTAVAEDVIADVLAQRIKLPVPPRLKSGASIDNFQILELLQENSAHLLYKVTEAETGRVCVLKTLTPERGADPVERTQLAHEEWLARRAVARFFPEVIHHGAEQRSALYFVQTWHPGRTLAEALKSDRHFPVTEALDIAI
jgi:sulfur transfer complex TusBCD TusB component (DsrH family)